MRNPKLETNSLILQPHYFNIFYHNEVIIAPKPSGAKAETDKKIFGGFGGRSSPLPNPRPSA
jgi:hypothetical protein